MNKTRLNPKETFVLLPFIITGMLGILLGVSEFRTVVHSYDTMSNIEVLLLIVCSTLVIVGSIYKLYVILFKEY